MKVAQEILAKFQSPGISVHDLDLYTEEICEANGTSKNTWEKSCKKHVNKNLDLFSAVRAIEVQRAKLYVQQQLVPRLHPV